MLVNIYANCAAFLHTLKNDQRGVTAIEYALVAVAVATIVAAALAGGAGNTPAGLEAALIEAFEKVANIIGNAGDTTPPTTGS